MSKVIASIVIFVLLFNVAANVVQMGVNASSTGEDTFDISDMARIRHTDDFGENITIVNQLEDPINPSGTNVEDAGDRIYRVLDVITLGFVFRFIDSLEGLMFDIVYVLEALVGNMLDDDLGDFLFGPTVQGEHLHGALHTILKLLYILWGISLFTGKNVTGENL